MRRNRQEPAADGGTRHDELLRTLWYDGHNSSLIARTEGLARQRLLDAGRFGVRCGEGSFGELVGTMGLDALTVGDAVRSDGEFPDVLRRCAKRMTTLFCHAKPDRDAWLPMTRKEYASVEADCLWNCGDMASFVMAVAQRAGVFSGGGWPYCLPAGVIGHGTNEFNDPCDHVTARLHHTLLRLNIWDRLVADTAALPEDTLRRIGVPSATLRHGDPLDRAVWALYCQLRAMADSSVGFTALYWRDIMDCSEQRFVYEQWHDDKGFVRRLYDGSWHVSPLSADLAALHGVKGSAEGLRALLGAAVDTADPRDEPRGADIAMCLPDDDGWHWLTPSLKVAIQTAALAWRAGQDAGIPILEHSVLKARPDGEDGLDDVTDVRVLLDFSHATGDAEPRIALGEGRRCGESGKRLGGPYTTEQMLFRGQGIMDTVLRNAMAAYGEWKDARDAS